MLNITYTPADAALAERLQQDLSNSQDTFQDHILIVLISPDAVQDKSVLKAIAGALEHKHLILPVILHAAPLPQAIADLRAVNLTAGYQFEKVLAALRRADSAPTVRQKNKRYGLYLLGVILMVFVISLVSLSTGLVVPPNDTFATDDALQNLMIETLTFPTLAPLMPHTTQEAQNFPLTAEAMDKVNDDVAHLLRVTATALPRSIEATQDAIATAGDLTSTARVEATQMAATETAED